MQNKHKKHKGAAKGHAKAHKVQHSPPRNKPEVQRSNVNEYEKPEIGKTPGSAEGENSTVEEDLKEKYGGPLG